MKFPLPERPFAPLQLSAEQCDAYERLAMVVVRECADELDEYVEQQRCVVDPRIWKDVKTKDNISVYKKRERETMLLLDPSAATASLSSSSSRAGFSTCTPSTKKTKWSLPKLMGVGVIVGDFDDVMYGVVAPTVASIQAKTSYVHDDIVDCDVLATIQRGSMDEPYRFVGIKWLAKASSTGSLVCPRDMVIVEATGTYINAKGLRYGYHAMHSVELPQCPSLEHMGIVRCTTSSCCLFTTAPSGSVEVFMTSFVEPGGTVPKSVAISSAANGLIGYGRVVDAAENKKLASLQQQACIAGSQTTVKSDNKGRRCCALCDQRFSTFRSPMECQLCRLLVCTRCETTRKLTYVTENHDAVKNVPTAICKNCVASVGTMPAGDFARRDNVTKAGSSSGRRPASSTPRSERARFGSGRIVSTDKRDRLDSMASTERSSYVSTASVVSVSVDSSIEELPTVVDVDELCETEALALQPTIQETLINEPKVVQPTSQREHLLMQMQQLRVQAEQAYELAAQNNHAMAKSLGPRPRPTRHIGMGDV